MGGGPRTPPLPSHLVVSRSSEDLVEVSLLREDQDTLEDPAGMPQLAPHPPTDATPSPPGTASSTPTDPLSSQASASADMARLSLGDEGNLAELLWSKSAVYVHPSQQGRDSALPGFLSIVRVRQGEGWQHLVSWIPEKLVEGTRDFDAYVLVELSSQHETDVLVHLAPSFCPEEDAGLASPRSHAFSHPITSLYSVQVQPPTLTSWIGTVTLSLFGGVTLPPLHFHDDESKSTVLDQDRRASSLSVGGSHSARQPAGGALAPSWGGEAFVKQLKRHARVVRSQLDPSCYLVNPSKVDLEAHAGGLYPTWDEDAVPDEALRGMRGRLGEGERGDRVRDRAQQQQEARTSILHQSSPVSRKSARSRPQPGREEWPDDPDAMLGEDGSARDGGNGGMDALTFSVLSGFSRITRGARQISQQAASTVLSHPLAKPLAKHVPKPIAQLALAPGEVSKLTDAAGVGAYDSARVYLAKWARIVAEEGERARRAEYGVDDSSFLEEELGESTGVFEVLAKTYRIGHKPRSTRAPKTPIQLEEWHAWFDSETRQLLLDEKEARRRIFQRGLADNDVRKEVWPFLLAVYPWTSTGEERARIAEAKSTEYERNKRKWMADDELQKTERFLEEDHRVEIDCRRTDRTHPLFLSDLPPDENGGAHPPTNAHITACHDVLMTWVFAPTDATDQTDPPAVNQYVQGMSDLFSPLYVVLEGEQWLAYSCFETVMQRQADNFREDQSGMKRQLSELQSLIRVMDRGLYRHLEETGSLNLFFCFRWYLCSFKREFGFDDTVRLWEILFTDHLGRHFHHFVALAILEANRDVMIRYLREFDEILKYVNELSQTLDLSTILGDAEVLYYTFRDVLAAASPAPPPPGQEGLRHRKPPASEARIGAFPPTPEDAEEARRAKVRDRTAREAEGLKELLE
ncbi:hypothetical protein NBRC10512_002744 [Rhodotorula toruloides]|uniref:RHTO0S11e05512g1_1 n=2 Tax=Rhodotorula toruloides TaxID=5286 RepID=A0A061B7F8_RHOTO|nr:GTPase activating protein [Rhodotorula toruloides NP11]EMS21563.1 GTPase activating protein [Rhodotorula toruloides NP11]CDR45843.1 RHTO0S11e05512g1_1 [Rhodotorula toruloides]